MAKFSRPFSMIEPLEGRRLLSATATTALLAAPAAVTTAAAPVVQVAAPATGSLVAAKTTVKKTPKPKKTPQPKKAKLTPVAGAVPSDLSIAGQWKGSAKATIALFVKKSFPLLVTFANQTGSSVQITDFSVGGSSIASDVTAVGVCYTNGKFAYTYKAGDVSFTFSGVHANNAATMKVNVSVKSPLIPLVGKISSSGVLTRIA